MIGWSRCWTPIFQRGIARDERHGIEQILILTDASALGLALPRLRPLMDAYDLSIRLCLPRQDLRLEEAYVEWASRENDRCTDDGLRAFLGNHIDDPLLELAESFMNAASSSVGTSSTLSPGRKAISCSKCSCGTRYAMAGGSFRLRWTRLKPP